MITRHVATDISSLPFSSRAESDDRIRRAVRLSRYLLLLCFPASLLCQTPASPQAGLIQDGKTVYAASCSGCHGADTFGTDHAPRLTGNSDVRRRSVEQLRSLISAGIPAGGMPSFVSLPSHHSMRSQHIYIPSTLPHRRRLSPAMRRWGASFSGARAIAVLATWFTARVTGLHRNSEGANSYFPRSSNLAFWIGYRFQSL